MSIADWPKPLGGFTIYRMSLTGGRDVAVAIRDCGITPTSQTRPDCKHRFSAPSIDETLSVEAQIGLSWCGFCSSSYRCDINAKDPSGWIQIGESRSPGVARIPHGLQPLGSFAIF